MRIVVPGELERVRFEDDRVTAMEALTPGYAAPEVLRQEPPTDRSDVFSLAATLYVSTTAKDADLFLTVRAYDTAGKEHLIVAASEFNAPLAQGWLRASHRKLDPGKSHPWQPVHTHDELQFLQPGTVYELEVLALEASGNQTTSVGFFRTA